MSHDRLMRVPRNSIKEIVTALAAIATAFVVVQTASAETPASKPTADSKRHIMLPTRTVKLPFSDGVLVGDTLYLAGKIGVDPETGKSPEDVEKEIRLLLDGMKATLVAA